MAQDEQRHSLGAMRWACKCGCETGYYVIRGGNNVVFCDDCDSAMQYNATKEEVGSRVMNTPIAFTLYRLRDSAGELLYVGITNDWPTRMKQHASKQSWWPTMTMSELVHLHCSRKQAEAIEKAVIQAEQPRHNVAHNQQATIVKIAAHFPVAASFPVVQADQWFAIGTAVRLKKDTHDHRVGEVCRSDGNGNYVVYFHRTDATLTLSCDDIEPATP